MVIMDIEAFDAIKTAKGDASTGEQRVLFALAMSDLVIVNPSSLNPKDKIPVGGNPLFRMIFEQIAKLEPSRKNIAVFLNDCQMERLVSEEEVFTQIEKVWNSVHEQASQTRAPSSEYFEVFVDLLPNSVKSDKYQEQIEMIREKFVAMDCARTWHEKISGPEFLFTVNELWGTIRQDNQLDLPAQKRMWSRFLLRKHFKKSMLVLALNEGTCQAAFGVPMSDKIDQISIFTEGELRNITNDYSTSIGTGGITEVYLGKLCNNEEVAVKVSLKSRGGVKMDYMNEVRINSSIRHANVVQFLGYCLQTKAPKLVYEYASNGNLFNMLHGEDKRSLTFDTRLEIATRSAEALAYIHSLGILHADVKSANILLDKDLKPKVSDFGLSIFLCGNEIFHTMGVKGTVGYIDPICIKENILTQKSDVYSFGVVLVELLTRKKPQALANDFRSDYIKKDKAKDMLDKDIVTKEDMRFLTDIAEIAFVCLSTESKERPEMKEVAHWLSDLSYRCQRQRKQFSNYEYERIFQNMAAFPMLNEVENIKAFTESELRRITKNYDINTLVGEGGYARVFTAIHDNQKVAVKVPKIFYDRLKEDFENEVRIMSGIEHENLVKLIGYCSDVDIPMLVYEFVPNGTLFKNLHKNYNQNLSLNTRLKIATGCAKALAHIHSLFEGCLIHRDIKSENILLEDDFTPKVSDFGLSKILPSTDTYNTFSVEGTVAYLDPCYHKEGQLTQKSDVYSFGIVLVELITRQPPSSLAESFRCVYREKHTARDMLDNDIVTDENLELLDRIAELAFRCVSLKRIERPVMEEVANCLFDWTDRYQRTQITHEGTSEAAIEVPTWEDKVAYLEVELRVFTNNELRRITNNYSQLLGEISFAKFYFGTLDNDQEVAVKVFHSINRENEYFNNEIRFQRLIKHRNVVELVGSNFEADDPQLVYEFLSNGTLYEILHGDNMLPLSLDRRLQIATGSAEGLAYIQSASDSFIIHGDVKSFNILLDDDFKPKISGFDMSRFCPIDETIYTMKIVGSTGYVDPKYLEEGILSQKSDVYSFGVVLLELITRKKATSEGRALAVAFRSSYRKGKGAIDMLDKDIVKEKDMMFLEEIAGLAFECVSPEREDRPGMKDVANRLSDLTRRLNT